MLSNSLFSALARLGTRAPVVVFLNGGAHSYYHDRLDGRWGSMVLDEAIPDAIRRFSTRPGRLAIGGVSMGGYGALHLAALRPHAFCAVGAHSAALWQSSGASAPGAFDNAADFSRNDVFAAARRGRYDGMRVWIDGGTTDPFRAADAAFAETLRRDGADRFRCTRTHDDGSISGLDDVDYLCEPVGRPHLNGYFIATGDHGITGLQPTG